MADSDGGSAPPGTPDLSDLTPNMRAAALAVIGGEAKRSAAARYGVCRNAVATVLFKKGIRARNRGTSLVPTATDAATARQEPEADVVEVADSDVGSTAHGTPDLSDLAPEMRAAALAVIGGEAKRSAAARYGVCRRALAKVLFKKGIRARNRGTIARTDRERTPRRLVKSLSLMRGSLSRSRSLSWIWSRIRNQSGRTDR